MVKTLKITSVLAAVLAAVFFTVPAFFGISEDVAVEKLLKSPGVIDKFNSAEVTKNPADGAQTSPLVVQAALFAKFLNPPKIVKKPPKTDNPKHRQGGTQPPPIPQPPKASAKFTVVAVSFYESRPDLSLAMIRYPNREVEWVRESDKVGHLTIEQIKDGVIVVNGGNRTYELTPEPRPARVSLLAGANNAPTNSRPTSVMPPSSRVDPSLLSGISSKVNTNTQKPMSSEDEAAMAEKLFAELAAMAGGAMGQSDSSNPPSDVATTPAPADPESMRITAPEAGRLGHLGEELKDLGLDNGPSRSKKIGIDKLRKMQRDRKRAKANEKATSTKKTRPKRRTSRPRSTRPSRPPRPSERTADDK